MTTTVLTNLLAAAAAAAIAAGAVLYWTRRRRQVSVTISDGTTIRGTQRPGFRKVIIANATVVTTAGSEQMRGYFEIPRSAISAIQVLELGPEDATK